MGLFGRLLKLHSGAVPLEDFFTEVVAHLFETEPQTCLAWLDHAGLLSQKERHGVRISTQYALDALEHHATGSPPDMLIEAFGEESFDAVLIESKIGSREGPEQLRRYAELLRGLPDAREKTLVYVTRDFDPKDPKEIIGEDGDDRVRFVQSRWHDFYHFLKERPKTALAQETLLFMEEQAMAKGNRFTPADVLALSNLTNALGMMEETMQGEVSEKFKEVTGNPLRGRAHTLNELRVRDRYLLYANSREDHRFWCGLGYHLPPPGTVAGYPSLNLFIEVNSPSPNQREIVGVMREIERPRGGIARTSAT